MNTTETLRGRVALCIAHVAGMIDMVALPVWVGTLIARYQFTPQQSGGLATLFLAGVVVASLVCAPRFNRFPARLVVPAGFGLAAIAFVLATLSVRYEILALAHVLGGIATGCSLSFTHGTMGRSRNPHRMFAAAQFSLGVFSIAFLGAMPLVVERWGGQALFMVFGAVMAIAAVATALFFPQPAMVFAGETPQLQSRGRIRAGVWAGIVGVSLMATVQSMIFSFVERVGVDRGFTIEQVASVLVAVGLVTLFPAVLAAVLQHRWPARRVMMGGPVAQAVLALTIFNAAAFLPYAVATSLFPFVMIFTHTFAFGYFAQADPTGRAVAATPAMNMIGSGIGPFVGGTLVQHSGYPALSHAAVLLAVLAVLAFAFTAWGSNKCLHQAAVTQD